MTTALREKCPPTRTLQEAQKYITSNLDSGYQVSKLLGVGTVEETYLAKDSSGKDVCIKILKDGITKNKILNDKQKFVDMVKNMSDKTADEKDYLLRNIEDLGMHTDDIATVAVLSGLKWIEPSLPILYSISGYKSGIGYRN